MVVPLPANACGRPVRTDRLRCGGKHCGATAIRVSAGSFHFAHALRFHHADDCVHATSRTTPLPPPVISALGLNIHPGLLHLYMNL
jgi:hypothetical protein